MRHERHSRRARGSAQDSQGHEATSQTEQGNRVTALSLRFDARMSKRTMPESAAMQTRMVNEASEMETVLRGTVYEHLERHKPEPGGCTCGFCAYSVEHVMEMFVRESGLLRLLEVGQAMRVHPIKCRLENCDAWDAALTELKEHTK